MVKKKKMRMFGLTPGISDSALKCLSDCHVQKRLHLFCVAPSRRFQLSIRYGFVAMKGMRILEKKRTQITKGIDTNGELC